MKGQAALEFLTTYGWAFLIIIVMIGAISYFGILRPSTILPSRCTTSPEVQCTDFQLQTTQMNINLKQALGKTIFFNNITCTYENNAPQLGTAPAENQAGGISWSPKNSMSFSCPAPLGSLKGQKVRVSFDITYTFSSGSTIPHVVSGEVFAEVQ